MSEVERARVVEELPGEVTWDEMAMPEGDLHTQAKMGVWQALKGFFAWQRRRVYLGTELPVYYPAERRFAPDLVVVLDAEAHPRGKWVVSHEGKGLDWVLEVHVGGDRKKDAESNVERYALLGISEYFIYDRARQRLHGYRLPSPEAKQYVPIALERGSYGSQVLGLELQVEEGRLRFWAGNALLLEDEERIARLQDSIEWLRQRTDEEARRLAEAQAELERLRHRGS
jgi:hypothetical protein